MMLPIKTKRDWRIAFVFTSLIVYGITHLYSGSLQRFLLEIGDYRMTDMNQPKSFGNVAATILVMAVLTFLVFCIQKKSWKKRMTILLVGIFLAGIVLAVYFAYCRMIVSAAGTEQPVRVNASFWGGSREVLDEELEEELVSACASLVPVDQETQQKLEKNFYALEGSGTAESFLIWITYPRKYGHQYDLMVCVYEDMIYIRKGYGNNQKELVTFCQDNGLIELVEEITTAVYYNPQV